MLRVKLSNIFFIVVLLSFFIIQTNAAVRTSTRSGNWNTGSTWVGGVAPGSSDDVVIAAGHTVTLTAAASITNVTINSTGILAGSTFLLTVTGNYTNDGTHSGSGGITLSGSGATISGTGSVTNTGSFSLTTSKSISASADITIAGTIALTGTITITNNGEITSTSSTGITGSSSSSTWVNAANSTLNVAGALLSTGTLTATANPNTINYNSTTATQTMKSATYYHLSITKGTRIALFSGTSTVNGNLSVNSGILAITGISFTVNGTTTISGRLTDSSATQGSKLFVGLVTINPGGSWANPAGEGNTFRGGIVNNGTFNAGTAGTCTFNTNNQSLSGNSFNFNTISVSGAINLTNYTTVTTNANVNGTAAGSTFINEVGSVLNAGNSVMSTGVLTASAVPNTVNYTRAGNQTIKSTTYHILTLSGSGNKTAGGALTVNSDFTVSGTAVFRCGTSLTHNFLGSWIINTTTATWFTYTTSGTINFNTPSTPAATSISGTSTSTIAFNSVNINNTSGFSTTKNFSSNGTLTVNSGATLIPSSTVIISGTGTLTGSGTVNVTRTTATADFSSQYSITSKTLANLTVDYTASGQTLSALTYGNLKVSGSITSNSNSATIGLSLNVTGTFTSTGGTITMNNGSSITNSGTLTFNNLTIAASASVTSSSSFTVGGTLSIGSSGVFTLSSPVTISGSSISNSGTLTFNDLLITGNVSTTSSFNITGSLNVSGSFSATGGTVTMSGVSQSILGTGTKAFNAVSFSGSISTAQSFSIASDLTVGGTFSATAGTVTFTNSSNITGSPNLNNVVLNNGTTVRLNTNTVLGVAGTFTLNTGTLDVTSNTPNTVNYNGTGAQNVVAATYHHLILSGGNTKTAAGAITTNGNLTIQTGTTFSASSFTHTIKGNWVLSGSFNAGTSTVQFTGGSNTTITGSSAFNVVTVNKTSSTNTLTLNNSISVTTLNMTSGVMLTGSNSVTITTTRTGSGIILGTIVRTHSFSNSTGYQFEGQNNSITFSSGASNISSISVTVTSGAVSGFPFSGSINREYNISVSSSGAYAGTLRLHYENSEVNGNNESLVSLWHYTSSWMMSGKTANDSSANWVEQSSLTDFAGRWTFSDDQNTIRWNGSISSAWETASNWTIVQGTPTLPPSSNDIVELGTASFTNQPTISSAVSVRSITFGSVSAVNLSLTTGGTLTTNGNINGTWSANSTHSINVQGQTLNVGGDFTLSDGTTGHEINLGLSSGSINITGTLTQSGNATVTFSGAGSISIGVDYRHLAGTLTSGTGTFVFNGTGTQAIGGVTYNNLTINKTTGTANLASSPAVVNGNLTLSTGGTFVIDTTISVIGNGTIGSGTTLTCSTDSISIGGNWANSGTVSFGSSTFYFNGTGSQTIGASSFNNITINKASGTATLSGNIVPTGNLKVLSGTFDLVGFTADRSISGGSMSLSNGATIKISGSNNFPSNYTSYTLGATSTTEYYGASTQTIVPQTYGNLTITNGGTNAKSLTGTTIVNGDLLVNTGATLDAGAQSLTLYGNWTKNGTFTPSTSSVTLAGTSKTLTGTTTFYALTVSGTYTGSNAITVNNAMNITGSYNAGSSTVTLSGNFTNNGSYSSSGITTFNGTGTQVLSMNSGFVSTGTVNFNGTVAPTLTNTTLPTFQDLNINNTGGVAPNLGWIVNGNFTVASGATFTGGSGSHTFARAFTNNGTVTSDGTLTFNPTTAVTIKLKGTTFTSLGSVVLSGSGQITLTAIALTFSNLTISNTNASGINPLAAWTINGDLDISAGSILNCGTALSHTLAGNLSNNGTVNGGTSTITMNDAGGSTIQGSGTTTFNNLTITGVITAATDINITGNFVNNGTFDATDNIVTFTGSSASTISGSTNPTLIDQLTIAKTSTTTTLSVNLGAVTSLTISSGTLVLGTSTITQDGTGGTLTMNNGTTIKIGGANNMPVFDDYVLDPAGTIEYNGTVSQTISAVPPYGALLFSNTGAKNITTSISATGNATINASVPVTVSVGATFSVGGSFNNAGILTNRGSISVGP